MSDSLFAPNDHELENEYDLSQMSMLHRGRYDAARRATSLASAPDLPALARRVSDLVAPDPRILLVYVFGSHAQGGTGPMSDLDLAALLTRTATVATLRAELAHSFSALTDEAPIDLIILNEAPIELAYSVIGQGRLLYERTVADRVEYEADVMSRYGDYLPFLRSQRKDILEAAGNDRRVQRYREALGRTQRTLGALGAVERTPPG